MILRPFKLTNDSEFTIYSEVDYSWFENLILGRNTVIISDANVFNLYPDLIKKYKNIILDSDKNLKNIDTILDIIKKLVEYNIDRNSLLIGVGGGVICDIVGFVSSIYMRGINFGFIPTTLLAQIDASIGGKNGINFGDLKNYIGTISQPEFIICDTNFLKSLSEQEFKSGLGEVLKCSLIGEYDLFEMISNENNFGNKDQRFDFLNPVVRSCICTKIKIVQQDIIDKNYRHVLNFGHTFGHCFEVVENIPHGIAVVKGMIVALDISLKYSYLEKDVYEKILQIFGNFDFDLSYKLTDKHFELLSKDKKKNGDNIDFVFLKDIGEPHIAKVKIEELMKAVS
ncbi:3-dehydroquinate synthase [Bacteroidales bacterium OttesenSCG-928-I21]|nr:3-dehydroquinate synthase [Bacteroidales bacterium OttesenSCG-928-I21]